MAVRFQLRSQFAVIINFSVEDQNGFPVFAEHGLFAGVQVDDLQAYGAQGNLFRFIRALLVGAAMKQGIRGDANASALKNTIAVRKSGYAAQTFSYLRPRRVTAPQPVASMSQVAFRALEAIAALLVACRQVSENPAVAQESTP